MAGYGFDQWRIEESQVLDIEANWKLISENFQEYYHLTWVHPELAKVSRVEDHYRYQGAGMYCGQTTTPVERRRSRRLARASGSRRPRRIRCHQWSPHRAVPECHLLGAAQPCVRDAARPDRPGPHLRNLLPLLPPSTPELTGGELDATRTFWIDVNNEDIDICQRSQRGLTRGRIQPARSLPVSRNHCIGSTTCSPTA